MAYSRNILITGGAGFIGSALCEHFLGEGDRVVCLDDFSTGSRVNIEPFLENPRFRLIEGDIRQPEDCNKACREVDFVLHQAALGSVPRSVADPAASHSVNVSGFVNMLAAARNAGIKRFVYASSSSVYGDSQASPKKEKETGEPLSPYAVTKCAGELYAGVFARTYGMQCIGLRYFNVFGRRQNPDGEYAAVIPRFIKRLIRHLPPEIYGNGEYSRDFTYIENVVSANRLAMESERLPANDVFNVACGAETSLNRLVTLLKEHLSRFDPQIARIEPIYRDPRMGDIPHSLASIEKARRELGYIPAFTLEQGIERAINWYWENLRSEIYNEYK